jgi:SRSO17 transposase
VRAACCSHVEGMNEHSLLTEDEAAFEGYLDTLAAALHHRSRKQPLRDYCTGLLLPEGAWSRPTCPGAHPHDAQDAAELRVRGGVER